MPKKSCPNTPMLEEIARGIIGHLHMNIFEAGVYANAWASMLFKRREDGLHECVFPECLHFLLKCQQSNGGWTSCDSKTDTILNTLAATAALKIYSDSIGSNYAHQDMSGDLSLRLSRAISFINAELSSWEPQLNTHPGSELLIPRLLSMLEDRGITFKFPGRKSLFEKNLAALENFDISMLYDEEPHPMLHYLEAFTGIVDMTKVCRHRNICLMMGPEVTTAYLLGIEQWDEECESRIRSILRCSKTAPSSLCSQSISQIGEVLKVLSHGFGEVKIEVKDSKDLLESLSIEVGQSTITIQGLHQEVVSKQSLEGNMGKNRVSNATEKIDLIASNMTGIEAFWTGSENMMRYKNLSRFFSMMTFAQVMLGNYYSASCEEMPASLPSHFSSQDSQRTCVIFSRILAELLSSQNNDGSWGPPNCPETTAYALLGLMAVLKLPYTHVLEGEIQYACFRGRDALLSMQHMWTSPNSLWVVKTACGSKALSEAYSIVALKVLEGECRVVDHKSKVTNSEGIITFSRMFSGMAHLSVHPLSTIQLSVLEASFYRPFLLAVRTDIFPQKDTTGKDKYLEYIPVMWLLPNTCFGLFMPPEYLLDMMVLSMWIFLVDEYMESHVAKFTELELIQFRKRLESIHPKNTRFDKSCPLGSLNGHNTRKATDSMEEMETSDKLETAVSVFFSFATAVMRYPRIVGASATDLFELRYETKNYLLHHITQLEDNDRFGAQYRQRGRNAKFETPRSPYHTWVHTVGAGHISGPFSFAFFKCWASSSVRNGTECFSNIKQKLMAYKMNSHIGAFCRIYNDFGSIIRDRDECNLNSVNFPEFFVSNSTELQQPEKDEDQLERAKQALLEAGSFERRCAIEAANTLYVELEDEGEAGRKLSDAIRVYIGSCEQFSDMYLTRDVTNRVK